MRKKIVVTGASGMLGGSIYRWLQIQDAVVEGWAGETGHAPDGCAFRTHTSHPGVAITESVSTVIHCAAMTDADACEKDEDEAYEINVAWPLSLAAQAAYVGARFVYVSTDAVYDDQIPNRLSRESDSPRPISVYARTKLAGEEAVLQSHPGATVVRTTMFGWTLPGKREKLAEQIIRALVTEKPIGLWGDAVFSPLHVYDLGRYLFEVSQLSVPGVLNVGARDAISKADFGREIADAIGADPGLVEETSVDDMDLLAKRTKFTGLDVTRASQLLGQLPSVREGIDLLARELCDGTVDKLKGGPWPLS